MLPLSFWDRVPDTINSSVADTLVWPVARLYTEKYLKQEDKDRISAMVDDILAYYHEILEGADFFSEETRAKAVEKLEAIDKFILYPDDWSKYSCEELSFKSKEEGGTYWDAMEAIGKFSLAKSVKEYPEPADKTKWGQPPHTVNCFYNPQANGIYIMGAFAQGSYYNSEMSDEELLQRVYDFINNPHPMGYLRINTTLQQYDEFVDFYGIKEGDGMYLAPEDRVTIW